MARQHKKGHLALCAARTSRTPGPRTSAHAAGSLASCHKTVRLSKGRRRMLHSQRLPLCKRPRAARKANRSRGELRGRHLICSPHGFARQGTSFPRAETKAKARGGQTRRFSQVARPQMSLAISSKLGGTSRSARARCACPDMSHVKAWGLCSSFLSYN